MSELPQRLLERGQAFMVPSFELAEALIAYGADSARIAILKSDALADADRWCAQIPLDGPLVPPAPFRFDDDIVIVLPTYNERQNLEAMITAIGQYIVADILVVDDNSPDGTGELADQLSHQHAHIHVLHREKKQGLGPAYVAGFQWAMARAYQLIIEMDCDFSHAPWDVPRLVHRSLTADLVIGSRYVPGGGTQDWNRRRRLMSQLGNRYVSLFLGTAIRDWTGGFRCYHRHLLADIDWAVVKARGYVFQVEMAWRVRQSGAIISEMPIRFSERRHGQSKLGWQSIIEAMTDVPRMYLQSRQLPD
jgi:dolichol-phosphate mannosyltransferase